MSSNGRDKLSTHEKALKINLDRTRYGTFAEIGAGQEVVRWFFRVGGASGTIAKSMSAYDMTVSDAIYGPCPRYVSRPRLEQMLEHEHKLTVDRLDEKRGASTFFFTFADTVVAQSYMGTNECHGWMGIRFQATPRSQANDVIIHVRMLDKENLMQQEALGIIGVNLIYGAFYHNSDTDLFLESLLDGLTTERVEIDMVQFSGPHFATVDNRLVSLKLVQLGLSDAAMFSAKGEVLQPSEVLYKKPILVERGSFRPVCHTNIDMLQSAQTQFRSQPSVNGEEPLVLMELTMRNLMASGEIDYHDFLARADMIATTGHAVLISDYFEYFRLAAYLSRFSKKSIGVVMGVPSLKELFQESYYGSLEGGILESFGRLFKNDLKLYVYPLRDKAAGSLTTVENLEVAPELQKLYDYLRDRGCIVSISGYNPEYLPIFSRDILAKIKAKDAAWETMVPPAVAELIKKRRYCGYRD